MNSKLRLLTAFLLAAFCASNTFAETMTVSEAIIFPYYKVTPTRANWPQKEQLAVNTLDQACSGSGPNLAACENDQELRSVLKEIAVDRQQHPELYRELLDYYTKWRQDGSRGGGVQELNFKHVRPMYRLAWEYMLLRPWRQAEPAGIGIRATVALQIIDDERSLPAAMALYRITVQKTPVQVAGQIQRGLLGFVIGFRSEKALRYVLEAKRISKDQQKEIKGLPLAWDIDMYIARGMSETPKAAGEWDQVLARAPKDLSAEDQSAMAHIVQVRKQRARTGTP